MDNLFMGKNGFYWFFGIVEDNSDPLGFGRCKVRIVGWHNPDDSELPTEALPWAYPVTSLNNAAIAGIGFSSIGPQINTRVFGFFADGEAAQQPIMLGTLQGKTIKQTFKKLPYGATPQQPIIDKLFGPGVFAREGDCPDGDDGDATSTDEKIPDPREVKINPGEWQIPTTGFVSSAYAERSGRHHGVDICTAGFFQQTDAGAPHLGGRLRGPVGQPVKAAASGEVVKIWTNDKGQRGVQTTYDKDGRGSRSYGNAIAIKHTLSTGNFITIYAHLGSSQDAAQDGPGAGVQVSLGQHVSAGQIIGTMGRTHNRDSLTHLHFEIRVGDSLPKALNHINPGRVFPQLGHRHYSWLSFADAPALYSTKIPFKIGDAPVTAGDGPKV